MSIAEEKVDWKQIREELYGFGFPEYQELQRFQEDNFDNLISALEEQEKRIEFLEKALEQAVTLGNISLKPMRTIHKDKTETESVNVDTSIQIQGRTVRAWMEDKEVPELAKYLEEKND